MTPLAQKIVRQLTLPIRKREVDDNEDVMHRMDDVHCFDVSEVVELMTELTHRIAYEGVSIGPAAFLPAPKTWIEYDSEWGRLGWLLIENDDRTEASVYLVVESYGRYWSIKNESIPLGSTSPFLSAAENEDDLCDFDDHGTIYAALALINSPRIVGRRQHMPHRGLERRLRNSSMSPGRFPLHAWTEILLEVRTTLSDETHEAHLTGKRCLHFCRAHMRVRNGRVEFVSSHWRGDAALGIKRTRYRLVA